MVQFFFFDHKETGRPLFGKVFFIHLCDSVSSSLTTGTVDPSLEGFLTLSHRRICPWFWHGKVLQRSNWRLEPETLFPQNFQLLEAYIQRFSYLERFCPQPQSFRGHEFWQRDLFKMNFKSLCKSNFCLEFTFAFRIEKLITFFPYGLHGLHRATSSRAPPTTATSSWQPQAVRRAPWNGHRNLHYILQL